jgi:hypothetical protein
LLAVLTARPTVGEIALCIGRLAGVELERGVDVEARVELVARVAGELAETHRTAERVHAMPAAALEVVHARRARVVRRTAIVERERRWARAAGQREERKSSAERARLHRRRS